MMKLSLGAVLVSVFAASVASANPLPVAPVAPRQVLPVQVVPQLRGPLPVLMCPDPAATAIDFAVVSKSSRYAGVVRISGTVKNVGNAPYLSGPNQQNVTLWETNPGGRPRLVATRVFQNLAPGEQVQVSFERFWNASSPAEGEFAPSYKVMIGYDPDILLDSNKRNDDCGSGNNVRERSGVEINGLMSR